MCQNVVNINGNGTQMGLTILFMQLVDEAFQRWLVEEDGVVDDITAVVVKFEYKE